MEPSDQPLSGVRVLDLTRILSGPYCTLLLADLGADVIKVERPGKGDDTRWWGPPFLDDEAGMSTYFASLNRGKRSVALDLSTDQGVAEFMTLVRTADIVVENFRPGRAEKLGIGPDRLREANPRIVSCAISGYGRTGEYAQLPGTEIVIEAMSGVMSITGPRDGDPVRFGIAMIDIATGLTAATRIVAELMRARETGEGAHVECSLYASALAALGTLLTNFTATGTEPTRWGSHHPTVAPYGGFAASDGSLITGVIHDEGWDAFCAAIESPELGAREELRTNAGRVENREELHRLLERHFATRSVGHWLDRLRAAGLLAAPIRSVGTAATDPATVAMELFVELDGYPGVISPRLDHAGGNGGKQRVPRVGEHTEEIFKELGADPPDAPLMSQEEAK